MISGSVVMPIVGLTQVLRRFPIRRDVAVEIVRRAFRPFKLERRMLDLVEVGEKNAPGGE